MKPLGFVLTFTSVVLLAVLFRANSMAGATQLLHAMFGLDGVTLPASVLARLGSASLWLAELGVRPDASSGVSFVHALLSVAALAFIATRLPNSIEVMQRFEPVLGYRAPAIKAALTASLSGPWALYFGLLLLAGVLNLNRISEFLYWQF